MTGATLEERQAAQAAIIVQDALDAAVADLQQPRAASGSENGAVPQGDTHPEAETDAAVRAQVSRAATLCAGLLFLDTPQLLGSAIMLFGSACCSCWLDAQEHNAANV